jgi:hypothetical protein
LRLICNRDTFGRALVFWGLFTSFLLLPAYLNLPDTGLRDLTLHDCIPFAGVALLSLLVAVASPARLEITVNPSSKTWAVRRRQLLGWTRIEEYDVGFIQQVYLSFSASEGGVYWGNFITQWGETFPLTDDAVQEARALRGVEAFTEPLGLGYRRVQVD